MSRQVRSVYDLPTGITFFLVGLGVGAILALTFVPRTNTVVIPDRRSAENATVSPAL